MVKNTKRYIHKEKFTESYTKKRTQSLIQRENYKKKNTKRDI